MVLLQLAGEPSFPDLAGEFSQNILQTIQPLLLKISLIAGGIAGLYILLILVRIYFERRKVKVLKDIRYNLEQMNIHYGLPHSGEKKSLRRRIWCFFQRIFSSQKGRPLAPDKKRPEKMEEISVNNPKESSQKTNQQKKKR